MEHLWCLYFIGEQFSVDDVRVPVIQALSEYFQDRLDRIRENLAKLSFVKIDLTDIDDEMPIEGFTNLLRNEPTHLIACVEMAIHLMLENANEPPTSKVIVRFYNFNPVLQLQNLMRSSNVEKFSSLRGTVVRMTSIQPLVTSLQFICNRCGAETTKHFPDGKYAPPLSCVNSDCRNRAMQPDRLSAVTVDYQKIRVQELFTDAGSDIGRVPKSIEIELKEDLVDSCLPGDVLTVSGIVKALKTDSRSNGKQETCLYVLYVVANSVVNEKRIKGSDGRFQDKDAVSNSDESFTLQELHGICAVHESEHLFELIVNSLCPGIFGHELVKAGLCLGLFSGVRKHVGSSHQIPMRGDIHVLMLGDPGLGKSQLLRACTVVAPRAVYVCGNSTSTAGLTVSMVKDSNGDSALEAGALVLADNGICCIDEFDKMTSDPQALLETMEQQSISIAKAGICCSLSARSTVFVAANPIGGHYNRTKTVLGNMKISAALLSRFDLVFVLLDDPDANRDELLSEHVLALHSGGTSNYQRSHGSDHDSRIKYQPENLDDWGDDATLVSRIKQQGPKSPHFDAIPPQLLRKYIAYAKEFVRPRLSQQAKHILKEFYLSLRRERNTTDVSQITTRQLESLIRLGEARARMELREIVTEQDAKDVVEIMKESLFDLYSDEFASVHVEAATTSSFRSKNAKAFIKKAVEFSRHSDKTLFTRSDLRTIAESSGIASADVEAFLDMINQQNVILCKGGNKYQLMCG